ncbi:unnamed protein product [Burkholderia pseudomallei]|nr:unnamed protein product [Burkholderia pseudomallei]
MTDDGNSGAAAASGPCRGAAPACRGRPSGPRRRTIHGAHVIDEKMKCASVIVLVDALP